MTVNSFTEPRRGTPHVSHHPGRVATAPVVIPTTWHRLVWLDSVLALDNWERALRVASAFEEVLHIWLQISAFSLIKPTLSRLISPVFFFFPTSFGGQINLPWQQTVAVDFLIRHGASVLDRSLMETTGRFHDRGFEGLSRGSSQTDPRLLAGRGVGLHAEPCQARTWQGNQASLEEELAVNQ